MEVYSNRKSREYIDNLVKEFELENLKATAIKLPKVKKVNAIPYTHFIRIDLLSITGSTLLDESNLLDDLNVFPQFKLLLTKSEELKKEGIFIKVRILLEYPYSESSLNRIQAEGSSHRATILEPNFTRDFEMMEQIDEDLFNSSFTVNLQKSNLRNLQLLENQLREEFGWNSRANPSYLTLKFAPFSIGNCFLIVNNQIFYDPYLYSKEKKSDRKLSMKSPLVQFKKDELEDGFKSVDDHFRYCWDLDITLDCEDATYYQKGKARSLSKIRQPANVSFENKAMRICKMKGMCGDEKAISTWKKQVTNQFNKYVADLSPTTSNESIFIACSWYKLPDDISSPNHYANLVHDNLYHDYSVTDPPIFNVQIMQATPTDFLANQIYRALDNSTIGIIILTKDVTDENGKHYSRPNVYHELGYLMKQLGKNRIIVLREKDVEIPSNISDIVRLDFESNRLSFRYHDVIEWINNMVDIPKDISLNALENQKYRLESLLKKDDISPSNFKTLISRIAQVKHRIETGHNKRI